MNWLNSLGEWLTALTPMERWLVMTASSMIVATIALLLLLCWLVARFSGAGATKCCGDGVDPIDKPMCVDWDAINAFAIERINDETCVSMLRPDGTLDYAYFEVSAKRHEELCAEFQQIVAARRSKLYPARCV